MVAKASDDWSDEMGHAIRVAVVRGVAIRVHPSMALLAPWAFWSWGGRTDDWREGTLFGSFVLLAIFISVIGHELAHALVAHRFGLAVRDVLLLPIGGMTRIEQGPLPPCREVAIALAGPVFNLLLAVGLLPPVLVSLFWIDALSVASLGRVLAGTTFTSLLVLTMVSNLLLAVVNLVPAFPMDGGRILRAWLSTVSDRSRATQLAVTVGYAVSGVSFLAGLWLRDPTLPLGGLFVAVAALLEKRSMDLERALQRLPVGQFAIWDGGGVRPDEPLAHALEGGPRDRVVVEQGKVVGMLWCETLLRHAHIAHIVRVDEVMEPLVTAVSPDISVYEAHRRMLAAGRPAIPVVETGSRYRGIFTSDRLTHVYRYIQAPRPVSLRWALLARALGLRGR